MFLWKRRGFGSASVAGAESGSEINNLGSGSLRPNNFGSGRIRLRILNTGKWSLSCCLKKLKKDCVTRFTLNFLEAYRVVSLSCCWVWDFSGAPSRICGTAHRFFSLWNLKEIKEFHVPELILTIFRLSWHSFPWPIFSHLLPLFLLVYM